MKKIKGVSKRILPIGEDVDLSVATRMPTFGNLFRLVLGGSKASNGEQSIVMFETALKFKTGVDEVDLEDAQFNVLKNKVSENKMPDPFVANVQGQLLIKLREAERG